MDVNTEQNKIMQEHFLWSQKQKYHKMKGADEFKYFIYKT